MKQNEKMLGKIREYPAEFDYLTGLPDRRGLYEFYNMKAMQLFMQCL